MACAAGHAADRRFCPDMIRSSPPDAAEIELQADMLSTSKRGRRLLVKWAQAEAESLVDREWPTICVVANALLERGRLSGRQVSALVRKYDRAVAAATERYKREHPDWEQKVRRKVRPRGRPPKRSEIAEAALQAIQAERFVSRKLYGRVVDRLDLRGFTDRAIAEALDGCDVFAEPAAIVLADHVCT